MTQTLLVGGVLAGIVAVVLRRRAQRKAARNWPQQLQDWRDDTSDPELKIQAVQLPPVKELKARTLTRMELLERKRG